MEYDCLPKDIQKRAKQPFVFVSYCQNDRDIYNRVKELVLYLRNRNINIIYDEGGLDPGTELIQFQNLILDVNCKRVLIVSDKYYFNKVQNNIGGAWKEYFNISNDYPNNISKYIPLFVDKMIPVFSGKVYIQFTDDTEFSNIGKILEPYKLRNKPTISKNSVNNLFRDADTLYENGNYNAALKKINFAIEIYKHQKRPSKSYKAMLYNLKLIICIKAKDIDNAISTTKELERLISDCAKMEAEKKASYLCNCALAYRMKNKDSSEYEECAKKAYSTVKMNGIKDDGYYACMYSTALFDTEQYVAAYKVLKEALKEYEKAHNKSSFCKDDYIMYIKIKGNLAEIAVAICESMQGGRKKKYNLLKEAKKSILEIIDIKEVEDEDTIQAEIYSIATKVFSALNRFYL